MLYTAKPQCKYGDINTLYWSVEDKNQGRLDLSLYLSVSHGSASQTYFNQMFVFQT